MECGTRGRARCARRPPIRACAASCPDLTTEAGPNWTIDTLRPYFDFLLECFGAQRLMWGSDWPVVNLGGSYQRWFAASVALMAGLTPQERAAILGGTARKFYGL